MPWLANGVQATISSNICALFTLEFDNGDRAADLVLPIEGPWLRTCTVDPPAAVVVLRAEDLLALAVVPLNPVAWTVVEELGFAVLRLAERLVRDKNATTAIA